MVEIFAQMKRASGEKWWRLHGELFGVFNEALAPRPRPWQWPVIQSPREAADEGERPEALALWRALDLAAREARREPAAQKRRPLSK